LVAFLALAGCTKGSGGAGEGAGNVSVAITAAAANAANLPPQNIVPPALVGVAHVYVTLQEVDLHVVPATDTSGTPDDIDDDRHWISVALPANATFDLMALQNGVTAALGRVVVLPAGKITQIRLILDKQAVHSVVLTNGTTCALDLSEVPATGIRIAHAFAAIDVNDMSPIRVVVDLDVVQSLRMTGTCAYRLDPVIEVARVDRDVSDDNPAAPSNPGAQGHEEKGER
jgi:hypothetical protein